MTQHTLPRVLELDSQGRYFILFDQVLGRGAYGTVYRAWRISLGRERAPVAVKFISRADILEGEYLERAGRESDGATFAGGLVTSVAVGPQEILRTPQGLFAVWSLVQGASVQECWETYGPIPPAAVAGVGADVAHFLAEIHDLPGGLHRDIKSLNTMVTPAGQVQVHDFGTTRWDEERRSETAAGAVPCSYRYVAPEGLLVGQLDPPSDLYQLGAMLYEMLTAQLWPNHPFDMVLHDRKMDALAKEMRAALPPDCAAADELVALIRQMISAEAALRPDAREVWRRLTSLERRLPGLGMRGWAALAVPKAMPSLPAWTLEGHPAQETPDSPMASESTDAPHGDDEDEDEELAAEAVLLDLGEEDGEAALDDEEETESDVTQGEIPLPPEVQETPEETVLAAQDVAAPTPATEDDEDLRLPWKPRLVSALPGLALAATFLLVLTAMAAFVASTAVDLTESREDSPLQAQLTAPPSRQSPTPPPDSPPATPAEQIGPDAPPPAPGEMLTDNTSATPPPDQDHRPKEPSGERGRGPRQAPRDEPVIAQVSTEPDEDTRHEPPKDDGSTPTSTEDDETGTRGEEAEAAIARVQPKDGRIKPANGAGDLWYLLILENDEKRGTLTKDGVAVPPTTVQAYIYKDTDKDTRVTNVKIPKPGETTVCGDDKNKKLQCKHE